MYFIELCYFCIYNIFPVSFSLFNYFFIAIILERDNFDTYENLLIRLFMVICNIQLVLLKPNRCK